jgi:hypothetical protein
MPAELVVIYEGSGTTVRELVIEFVCLDKDAGHYVGASSK